MRVSKTLTILFLGVLAAGFAHWCYMTAPALPGLAAATVSVMLFAWAGVRLIAPAWAYITGAEHESAALPALRRERPRFRHPLLTVFLAAVASRLLLWVAAYALDLAFHGYQGGMMERWYFFFRSTDAPHYIGIANNWYVTAGDPRFHIVFLPLYPILTRMAGTVLGSTYAASLAVSLACFGAAAALLYKLALEEMGKKAAERAVRYLLLLPAGFFFAAPMAESLFLLLSIGCVSLARRRRFFLAGALGMLAAFTRSPGMLLAVPLGIEAARSLVLDYKKNKGALLRGLMARVPCVLMVFLGFGAYLLVNQLVTGNAWQFAIYQREHWYQQLGWFFNTAQVQLNQLLHSFATNDAPSSWGLWLPNLLAQAAALLLIGLAAKKLRPVHTVYALAYFFIVMGATWLLSAPRYLAGMYALPLILSSLTQRKKTDAAATVLLALGSAAYLCLFVAGYKIY